MKKKIAFLIAMCLNAFLVFAACSSKTETSVSEEADEGFVVETEGPAEIIETPYEPDFLSGLDNFYVLEGSENIDYEEGLLYDTNIVTDILVDDSGVDLSTPGVYTVAYTILIDDDALGEEPIDDVIQYRTVEVVDNDRAAELAAEGELIWGSNNTVVGIRGTEDEPL